MKLSLPTSFLNNTFIINTDCDHLFHNTPPTKKQWQATKTIGTKDFYKSQFDYKLLFDVVQGKGGLPFNKTTSELGWWWCITLHRDGDRNTWSSTRA
jgi:hypothetical protein